ncbi:MAG: beta-ketoacyl-ACP synthase II [Alphaproteobacteria bacterium]|nr:MAG: beta-ketoacyl-ACP synthase II [Alphaproteobacteria bacterium]
MILTNKHKDDSERIVITGMGIVSPLGVGFEHNWKQIQNKVSGIVKLDSEAYKNVPSKVAGLVPSGENGFDINKFMTPSEQRRNSLFISYAVGAVDEAVKSAKLDSFEDRTRIGTCIASGIGGLPEICSTCKTFEIGDKDYKKINPFFIPSVLTNLAPGFTAIKFNFQGPNYGTSSACASAAHAISDAAMLIKAGHADIMVAGGAEAAICPLGVGGFAALRALSTSYNDSPSVASRPFDKGHDGFVIAEGAGVIVLESLASAKRRNVEIYGEFISAGITCDASHITAPNPEHSARAMKYAVEQANIGFNEIGYINAHATSTPVGDKCELEAVKSVFGEHVYSNGFAISATKSYTGHLLGAAGGIEAIFTLGALMHQELPPTLNVTDPIDEIDGINYVKDMQKHSFEYAISNSFGFGGTNISLLLKRFS